jgi:type I restriction enzyme S subunit
VELKPGYKQTEVGVIPAEWIVSNGLEITSLIGKGASPKWQGFEYSNSGMLFVTSENVREGFLDISDPKYLSLVFHDKLNRTKLQQGDILINIVGASIGRSCLITCDLGEANVNQAVAVFRVNRGHSAAYVGYFFQSPATIARILHMQVDAARPNVSLTNLRNFLVPIPPLPEQQAIAGALSDVDALIGGLDKLIAKKRDIKQAAMQQLLTGEQRLPGFSGKWKRCLLSELGYFSKGKGIKKDELVPDGKACVRYGEIYTRHNDYVREFHSFISDEVASGSQRLRKGDLLFAGSGETAEEIGKCVAFLGDEEAYAGGDIVIFTPSDQDSLYFGYLMNHASITCQKAIMGQGDAVVHISARNLGRLELLLPPCPEEQTAIAAVLSDMDAEIAALEQRRDKTRALKQGMMQELLTGKTRLV